MDILNIGNKMSGIGKYVNYTPREIRSQLRVIGDETNLGILTYLLCEGESDLRKISNDLRTTEKELENRLKLLTQNALVESYYTRTGLVYAATLSTKQLMFGLVKSQDLTEEQINEGLEKITSGYKK